MNSKRPSLQRKTLFNLLRTYFLHGLRAMENRRKRLTFLIGVGLFLLLRGVVLSSIPKGIFAIFLFHLYKAAFTIVGLFLLLAGIIYMGIPKGAIHITDNLCRTGFVNSAGESPVLLASEQDVEGKRIRLEFDNVGLPLSDWEDSRDKLAAALNMHVLGIEQGGDNRRIILRVMPSDHQLPSRLIWTYDDLSEKDFELVLGESITGQVKVDLNRNPHILIGGSTGSGKTILLRCLILQCLIKGAKVLIADFKGVDFHRPWREHCEVITDPVAFEKRLEEVLTVLQARRDLLSQYDCADLCEFTSLGQVLPHIIIACDEVSELLDKTGAGKEDKERISRTEAALSTIARQGRAFGIHLILATQRPDANVLPGQIKNNIDCRICGRADNVLSQIILDSTAAADSVPKNATGRFLTNDGTVLQGYYVDDSMIAAIRDYKDAPEKVHMDR